MTGLHQIKRSHNSQRHRKRVGRGNGSGRGTFSGRGSKGQKQHGSVPFLFEGGQLPLIKRLPHMRGFTNIFRVESTPVNLSKLESFRTGSKVTPETLLEAGIVGSSKKSTRIKILGNGELTKKLNVSAHGFSKSARLKIEAAGGTINLIGSNRLEQDQVSETSESE